MKTKGKPKKEAPSSEVKDAVEETTDDKLQNENFNSFDNLRRFFDKVKSIGIIERIIGWGSIVSLSYDAYNEFKSFESATTGLRASVNSEKHANSLLNQNLEHQKDESARLERELEDSNRKCETISAAHNTSQTALSKYKTSEEGKQKQLDGLQRKYEELEFKFSELGKTNKDREKEIARYTATEEDREKQYNEKVTNANQLIQQLEGDRQKVKQERETEIAERFEKMKDTWRTHEHEVEQTMREICHTHHIEYVDKEKVPFKGKPDNTIKICEEYIIFDAKSPQGEDLENFPRYIRQQAEAAKKYTQEKSVKKEVFLVVPQNTLDSLEEHFFNMADYNVYAISAESIEPIMLSLAKIEEYEFAEKLSPEDRDTICRTIAKFAHATKRRIQIDSFFCNEFIGILNNCNNLPQEILEKSLQYEKSDKLNPPIEKRAKLISGAELKKDVKQLKLQAKSQEIDTEADFSPLNSIPVEKKEGE